MTYVHQTAGTLIGVVNYIGSLCSTICIHGPTIGPNCTEKFTGVFFGGSKLLLPSSRPDSKTNFVVAKLYVHFYAVVVLGCVDDRITNITQKCIKLTIP